MGLFSAIKNMIKFRKELKKSIEEAKENEKRYLEMTVEELSALSDDELFEAVTARTESKVDSFDEWECGVNSLNPSQKIFYSVNWLEMEVNNGGLCQFFVNSSRMVAPLVSEYMGIILTDKKYFGQEGWQYLGYTITKIVCTHRDYLPEKIIAESRRPSTYGGFTTEVEDWRSEVVCSLIESIAKGDRENAISNAYKALDKQMVVGNYKSRDAKTLPKEEILDQDFRRAVADLCTLIPKGIDDYFSKGFTKAIYELFDKVKKAHKFATEKRWKCFEYYILNLPNSQISDLLAISKQKASQNNRQVLQWFIDEVNNLDAKSLARLGLTLKR